MKNKVLQEVRVIAEHAKKNGKASVNFTVKNGETSSLGKAINTPEKAQLLRSMLKAL